MKIKSQFYVYKKGNFLTINQNSKVRASYRTWIYKDKRITNDISKYWNTLINYLDPLQHTPIENKNVEFYMDDVYVHQVIKDALMGQSIGNAILIYIPYEEAFGDVGLYKNLSEKIIESNNDILIEIKLTQILEKTEHDYIKKRFEKIILGTFPFTNAFSNNLTYEEKKLIVKKHIDSGACYIHTSLVYNNGKVEKEIGQIIKDLYKEGYKREKFKIIASCGWCKSDNETYVKSGKREDIINCYNISCSNLGLKYIDILMVSLPDEHTPYKETIDTMVELKKNGKIGGICVSNVTLEQLKSYNYNGNVDYVQQRYSFINRNISSEMFSYCSDNDIQIMAYQVLERGLLTEKSLKKIILNEYDIRNEKNEFQLKQKYEIQKLIKEEVKPLCKDLNLRVQELVIGWTFQNVDYVLIGVTKTDYYNNYERSLENLNNDYINLLDEKYLAFEENILNNYGLSVEQFLNVKL